MENVQENPSQTGKKPTIEIPPEKIRAMKSRKAAEKVKEGLEKGTSPLLPNANGQIKPERIINSATGFPLGGKSLVDALVAKAENGFKSNVVTTFNIANDAKTGIQKGTHQAFSVAFVDKKTGVTHDANYFFADQTQDPAKIMDVVNKKGVNLLNTPNEVLKVNSVDEYMPAFIAASKTGATVEVSPEIAQGVKEKLISLAETSSKYANQREENAPTLSNYLFAADQSANKIFSAINAKYGQAQNKEQAQQPKKIENTIER